jgi:integrase
MSRSHRTPVEHRHRRVEGLYTRETSAGKVYEFAGRIGGRVVSRRLAATNPTEAVEEIHRLHADPDAGKRDNYLVADLVPDYLAHLKAQGRHAPRTLERYSSNLTKHVLPVLGSTPVAELRISDVRRLSDALNAKGLAPATITGAINIFSGLCRFAVNDERLERNPVREFEGRPGTKRQSQPTYLTEEQVDALLDKLTATYRVAAAVMAFAGLRVSECLGLTWGDLDFEADTLRVMAQLQDGERVLRLKTASSAVDDQPMPPRLRRELLAHREREARLGFDRIQPDALVFKTTGGRPLHRRNILRAIRREGGCRVHDLRHSFVAATFSAGVPVNEAAAVARHSSPRTTLLMYGGVSGGTERKREAVRLLEASGYGQ